MALVKNEEIYKLKGELESVDPSTLQTLGTRDADSLGILSSRISGVLDGSGDDNWDDNVKGSVNSAIETIVGYIEKGVAASNFITNGAGPVTNLKTACETYCTAYDRYVEEKEKHVQQYEMENGEYVLSSSGSKIVRREYVEWEKNVKSMEKHIPELEQQALDIEQAVKNYFAAIDLATNTIDSSIYVEGSADIKFDFSQYMNGIQAITVEDWVGDPTTSYDVDDQGHIVEKVEGEYHREYEDGSTIDTQRTEENTYDDINGDGHVDEEDRLIYQRVHEEGQYTDPAGNVYGYVSNSESDEIGLVHQDVTLTDAAAEEVYHSEEDREFAGDDPMTGFDSTEYSTEERQDGQTTCTWTSSTSIEGQTISDEAYSFTLDGGDGTGEYVAPNGATSRYYRDDQGRLHEEFTDVDKDGNPKEPRDNVVDESERRVFRITRDGEVVAEYVVNPGSNLDAARMRYDLDQARAESGLASSVMDTQEIAWGMLYPETGATYSTGINGEVDYEWSCEPYEG